MVLYAGEQHPRITVEVEVTTGSATCADGKPPSPLDYVHSTYDETTQLVTTGPSMVVPTGPHTHFSTVRGYGAACRTPSSGI